MKSVMFVVSLISVGGLERVNTVIANKLGENHRVSIYSTLTDEESVYPLSIEHFKNNKKDNWFVIINLLRIFGVLHLKFMREMIYKSRGNKIKKIINEWKPQTVVLNAENILFLPYLKEEFPEVNFVAWIHNNSNVYFKRAFLGIARDFKKGLSLANTVICLTSVDLKVYGKYNKNTKVIYNPLTIENEELSILNEKVISWTGRLSNPHKGIDYLAEIASKLPNDWKISVAGSGKVKLFKKYVNRFNCSDKIIYRGSLNGEELRKHYLNSSIYLMTSRWEGFPLVLGEAMTFGLPIIAFKQSGSNEALKDGKYGILIDNGDVAEIVEHIKKLIENIDLRREYSEKSLSRVKDFNITNIVQQWEMII